MQIPSDFDRIRPFQPEELPAAYKRLCADEQFRYMVSCIFPKASFEALEQKLYQCNNSYEFQVTFCYPFLADVLKRTSKGCDMDLNGLDVKQRYTFVSNHRDIVLDSAYLDIMLIDAGFNTTCEIAIGDNLLAAPWIKDLVRVNKTFIVERSAGIREMLASSKRLAEYMHFVIMQKHDNVWIAQREGRAKDSDDRTQEAILKMMTMGGEGTIVERLKQLCIVPLSISYEYDACDYLKAQEFQLKRDVAGWKKTKADDVLSMKTGFTGYKGHIHYHCAPCINDFLDQLDPTMSKGQLFRAVATYMDRQIHQNYRIYASNYVAFDDLEGSNHADCYTPAEKEEFHAYIDGQLAKIQIPNKDEAYLRERMLTMYANPLRNHLKACADQS